MSDTMEQQLEKFSEILSDLTTVASCFFKPQSVFAALRSE